MKNREIHHIHIDMKYVFLLHVTYSKKKGVGVLVINGTLPLIVGVVLTYYTCLI